MTARWATLLDVTEAINYAIKNGAKGNLDLRIYTYPTLRIMRTANGEGSALAYLPVHTCAILESLGWAPELDAAQKAAAAIEAVTHVEREAYAAGYREIFFVCSDDRTDEFCQKKLGYEKVTAMRKRL